MNATTTTEKEILERVQDTRSIESLKAFAKQLAKLTGTKHVTALHRVAAHKGYKSWQSLLATASAK
jgi:hypothetical protein